MAEIKKVIETVGKDGNLILSNLLNSDTGEAPTYKETNLYYDGSLMSDDKCDGVIYRKYKSKYFIKVLNNPDTYLEKDTMIDMRNISNTEILLLKMNYYKGVTLNGYYEKEDTPSPIKYYISGTFNDDDGGSIIDLVNTGDFKLVHIFTDWKDVSYFGAKGDGIADDRPAIQKAFDLSGKIRIMRKGRYMIDAVTRLIVKSNSEILWGDDVEFKAIPTAAANYRIINIPNATNVILRNPVLIGERYEHLGTEGEAGTGLYISSSSNVKIYNPICNDFWADGMGINNSQNLYIENLQCDRNRRQGVSIASGRDILFNRPVIKNTGGVGGTPPMCGIDIEPNTNADYMENIVIMNPITENNSGSGIIVGPTQLYGANKEVSVKVINHIDRGSTTGFQVAPVRYHPDFKITGEILLENPNYDVTKSGGIWIRNYSAFHSPVIRITNPTINNPNTDSTGAVYGGGIILSRTILEAGDDTHPIGNVVISKPYIEDNRDIPLITRGIFLNDDKNIPIESVLIDTPLKIKGLPLDRNRVSGTDSLGIKLIDPLGVLKVNMIASTTVLGGVSVIENLGATSRVDVRLDQRKINNEITFTNRTSFGMRITPQNTYTITPISKVIGEYIQTLEIGASITIELISSTEYKVKSMSGKWTLQSGDIVTIPNATTSIKGLVNQAAISNNTATSPGDVYNKSEVESILTELRDLKTKLRNAGLLNS